MLIPLFRRGIISYNNITECSVITYLGVNFDIINHLEREFNTVSVCCFVNPNSFIKNSRQ